MTNERMLKKFDERIVSQLNDALWYLNYNHKELARQSVEAARVLVWVADDLELLNFDDWSTINRMLLDTYYRLF